MFAEVSLPISSFKTFTYLVPENLETQSLIGSRVTVPFGNRKVSGVIVSLMGSTSFSGEVKSISSFDDDAPIISQNLWKLVRWVSHYYITPIGVVYNTVLPFNISKNYIPRQSWFVKNISKDIDLLLKKTSPKQDLVYKAIQQSSQKYIKVSSLKNISSNPISICKALQSKGCIELVKKDDNQSGNSLTFNPVKKNISYNEDQLKVIDNIKSSLKTKKFKSNLLHGVTGSGKTEIFIEVIKAVIKMERSAIILIPEISLTPQIAGRFKDVFGQEIALWHSQLTKSQRAKTWNEINNGDCKIVIGARSAVFSPVKKLGLIIVDEEHDSSFKQDSPSPRYHARDVAIMRAKIEECTVILSSATPSLETFYNYKNSKHRYLSLPKRYGKAVYPAVKVVDLIDESKETGKFNIIISGTLQRKIEEKLKNNEQVLLIQNRRGHSPTVKCSDCGSLVMCSACKTPLTFHKYDNKLKCHICGFISSKILDTCKDCQSQNFLYVGTGTQKVESILQETFPNAKISRVDHDSTKKDSSVIKILQSFLDGKVDILLGTQMIAKGLDFPGITLVGIINADLGLHLPDFRSSERTFQLIYQASGRAGRGQKKGEVIIQTYDKDNAVIQAASRLNLEKYYEDMLDDRQLLNYPPYSWVAKIEFIGSNPKSVFSLSNKIRNNLMNPYKGLEILGPAPCFKEKVNNKYRFQIILKSSKKYDVNSSKLHFFVSQNFVKYNNKVPGSNKIHIHIDPVTMI
ncbi:primosomal protein N' [Candidatus Marinimicrobia bacterium]|nr:primosomal protein N' [Candidatus Neomarinimicrobiota bacterium]